MWSSAGERELGRGGELERGELHVVGRCTCISTRGGLGWRVRLRPTSSDLARGPRALSTPSPSQKRSTVDKLSPRSSRSPAALVHVTDTFRGPPRVHLAQVALAAYEHAGQPASLGPARERCHGVLHPHARATAVLEDHARTSRSSVHDEPRWEPGRAVCRSGTSPSIKRSQRRASATTHWCRLSM